MHVRRGRVGLGQAWATQIIQFVRDTGSEDSGKVVDHIGCSARMGSHMPIASVGIPNRRSALSGHGLRFSEPSHSVIGHQLTADAISAQLDGCGPMEGFSRDTPEGSLGVPGGDRERTLAVCAEPTGHA